MGAQGEAVRWTRLRIFVQALSLAVSAVVLPSGLCWIAGRVSIACPYGMILRITSIRLWMPALAVAAMLPVLLTVLLGRFFCGWLCPVGAVLDICRYILPSRGEGRGVSVLSRFLGRVGKYFFSGAFIILSYACKYPVFCAVCPVRGICGIGRLRELGLSILPVALAPFILEVDGGRSWCRYVCPLGGFLGLLSAFKPIGLKIDGGKCRSCKLCIMRCRFDALTQEQFEKGQPKKSECVLCLECMDECRFGAISLDISL